MKSFWMNLGVADLEKSAQFYEKLGFAVASFGDVRSVTLPEGGNLILMQTETFAQRVPFQLAEKGNEVLISLNVNQNLIIPTIVAPFWCQLVLIIVISRLRDLKHRHLAGAFFLASILDNTVVLLRLSYDLDDEKYSLG